jgi:pSer/pThr/pTyr-binding forkhead associated (FHA) protein
MLTKHFYAAAQAMIDARRLGQHSLGLTQNDLADIFCRLCPTTTLARQATALIADADQCLTISIESTEGTITVLALRLSTNLKNSLYGYRFGRNEQRCDFFMGLHEKPRRISNVHFRIYISERDEYGVVMLEDESTNGTMVDGVLLHAKDRYPLKDGSTITMALLEEDLRFIVQIP